MSRFFMFFVLVLMMALPVRAIDIYTSVGGGWPHDSNEAVGSASIGIDLGAFSVEGEISQQFDAIFESGKEGYHGALHAFVHPYSLMGLSPYVGAGVGYFYPVGANKVRTYYLFSGIDLALSEHFTLGIMGRGLFFSRNADGQGNSFQPNMRLKYKF